jgi:hypothetical protein
LVGRKVTAMEHGHVHGVSLVQIVAICGGFISVIGAVISYLSYLGTTRQSRLNANQRLMELNTSINKLHIEHPELSYLTNPDKFDPPGVDDKAVREQLRQLMYMYLDMFDISFNYYGRKFDESRLVNRLVFRLLHRFGWNKEEIDHWGGWQNYTSWFVYLPYVEEIYPKDKGKYYGREFKQFIHRLNNKLPPP